MRSGPLYGCLLLSRILTLPMVALRPSEAAVSGTITIHRGACSRGSRSGAVHEANRKCL